MAVHRLDRTEARRIAVRAQLLDAPRPTGLLDVVRRLTFVQIDPTAAVAPSADLVLWSRLGGSYRPAQLQEALEKDRALFEHNAMVRPMDDLELHLPTMAAWPGRERQLEWLRANDRFRRDVLDRLGTSGPLASREIPDTSAVAWRSTGWTDNRNVTQMLEFLMMRGEVAVAGRRGRQRLWDLAERVYPDGTPVLAPEEARRERSARRLRSLGIARATATAPPADPVPLGEAGDEAVVDGLPGTWRVDPEAIGRPFTGRTALLSPFDRLVHDRARALELFGFEYVLEMYKPRAQRRWGYFALPVLHHDRLVGKVDATADRRSGRMVVHALHEDVPWPPTIAAAVHEQLQDLASWLGLALAVPGPDRRRAVDGGTP